MNETELVRLLRIALLSLSEKVAVFVALLMMFILGLWAMSNPQPGNIIVLGVFGLLVFLPVLLRSGSSKSVTQSSE